GVVGSQQSAVSCYPNPSNGLYNIGIPLTNPGEFVATVYDLKGSICYQERVNTSPTLYSSYIDIRNKPAGTYFLKITQNGKAFFTQKLIKY
ncbi:MAG: T9SS type A sorting domain-containing protein, partial [Bacteroidota bacterium]